MTNRNNKSVKKISTKNMSGNEWLELRTKSIGGSDCGSILGMNKWESPYSLWVKKVYPDLIKENQSENEFIYWGNELEDVVAKEFEKRTGKKVRKHNFMMYHSDYDFISANVDRFIVGENAILECKTASEYKKSEWLDDNIPGSYMAQCYHYMAVTGVDAAYIAVLIGGNHFVWKKIERDDEVIDQIIKKEVTFWNDHVLTKEAPEIDSTDATSSALNKFWRNTIDETLNLQDDTSTILKAMTSIDNQIKELKEQRVGYENQIKSLLGEHERGLALDGSQATWKRQKQKRIDTKRLKSEQPEIYEKYIKEVETRPLKIKVGNA